MNEIVLKTGISGISGLGLFTESFIPVNAIIIHAFTTFPQWSNEIEPTNWLNHSKKSNLSILKNGNKIFFYANRDIKKGEELSLNYADLKKYNCPLDALCFEKDKALFQNLYSSERKNKSRMYQRPVGTKYIISYDKKV